MGKIVALDGIETPRVQTAVQTSVSGLESKLSVLDEVSSAVQAVTQSVGTTVSDVKNYVVREVPYVFNQLYDALAGVGQYVRNAAVSLASSFGQADHAKLFDYDKRSKSRKSEEFASSESLSSHGRAHEAIVQSLMDDDAQITREKKSADKHYSAFLYVDPLDAIFTRVRNFFCPAFAKFVYDTS